jgi:tryptophan 2,3-dioxygenase
MDPSRPANYWDYIRVEELLGLQGGLERNERELANDEVLFIAVHQVYELWFKLILRELVAARDVFRPQRVSEQALSGAVHSLRRISVILRRAVDHFEIMETLRTREYLAFRDKLTPASGFQSAQLRQIEILLGLESGERIPYGLDESFLEALRSHDGSESSALSRVRATMADRPTLREAIEEWLHRTPIDGYGPSEPGAQEALAGFIEAYLAGHAGEVERSCAIALARTHSEADRTRLRERYARERDSVRAFFHPSEQEGGARTQRIRTAMVFIVTYRELPLLAWPREVLEALIEMEQQMTVWRQRHARMVERVIGRRTGTGGSAGVDYLDQTAQRYRVFRDLWAVRTLQVRLAAAPALRRADFYGFRNG